MDLAERIRVLRIDQPELGVKAIVKLLGAEDPSVDEEPDLLTTSREFHVRLQALKNAGAVVFPDLAFAWYLRTKRYGSHKAP